MGLPHLYFTGSRRRPGFALSRGVRQGCPLSPLLFAVAVDIFLRRIGRRIPDCTLRAYADDTALVHQHVWRVLPELELLFSDFHRVSGLALNIDRTVFVPLSPASLADTRDRLTAAAPLWGSMTIAHCAKYLGFVVGP